MTPPEPFPTTNAGGPPVAKLSVPPELIEWARASCGAEDIELLLAEARAGGSGSLRELLRELETPGTPPRE